MQRADRRAWRRSASRKGVHEKWRRMGMARTCHRDMLLHYTGQKGLLALLVPKGEKQSSQSPQITEPTDKTGQRTSFLWRMTMHQLPWRRPLISKLMWGQICIQLGPASYCLQTTSSSSLELSTSGHPVDFCTREQGKDKQARTGVMWSTNTCEVLMEVFTCSLALN